MGKLPARTPPVVGPCFRCGFIAQSSAHQRANWIFFNDLTLKLLFLTQKCTNRAQKHAKTPLKPTKGPRVGCGALGAFLKTQKAANGANGADGADGPNGANGEDRADPHGNPPPHSRRTARSNINERFMCSS